MATNKELVERTKMALLSRAVSVPSIEEREKQARRVAIQEVARAEVSVDATATVFVAMTHHCARRKRKLEPPILF